MGRGAKERPTVQKRDVRQVRPSFSLMKCIYVARASNFSTLSADESISSVNRSAFCWHDVHGAPTCPSSPFAIIRRGRGMLYQQTPFCWGRVEPCKLVQIFATFRARASKPKPTCGACPYCSLAAGTQNTTQLTGTLPRQMTFLYRGLLWHWDTQSPCGVG